MIAAAAGWGGYMEIVLRNLPMEIVILTIIPLSFNPKFLLIFRRFTDSRLSFFSLA